MRLKTKKYYVILRPKKIREILFNNYIIQLTYLLTVMKHSYRIFAMAAVVSAAVATASAQSPVYITGNVPGLTATWTPEEATELTYADGVYTYDMTGAKQGQTFKLSTAKGDWTTFNASAFGMADDNGKYTLPLNSAVTWTAGKCGNMEVPATGDFKLVVNMDAKTLELQGEGTFTDIFDIYILGEATGWTANDAYKFNFVEKNATGENVYELTLPEGLLGQFKVATSDWSAVNYGVYDGKSIEVGQTTELRYNANNITSTITESVKLTFYHNLDSNQSSWLKVDRSSGIEEIDAAEDSAPVYYNLQGVRVDRLAHGVYIKVAGDKVSKVLVK